MNVTTSSDLQALLRQDVARWRALSILESMKLPCGCIGAGFIRNFVWDHLHDRKSDCRDEDVDVLWYDPWHSDPLRDELIEAALREIAPEFKWSVKNQARMHLRNGDEPYESVEAAMRAWPETATAVAVRRVRDSCEIIAPFGLNDLISMVLRPTSTLERKLEAFEARVSEKRWLSRWPQVRLAS